MFLPGESQGQKSLVGCHLWGRTESDTTEVDLAAAAAAPENDSRLIPLEISVLFVFFFFKFPDTVELARALEKT